MSPHDPILRIRVSTTTDSVEAVFRAWPDLCALAWPGRGEVYAGTWRPESGPAALAPPIAPALPSYGVRELAEALLEQADFGEWPEKTAKQLEPGLKSLYAAQQRLENALADWRPQEALQAAHALEDALDTMQDALT